MFLPINCIYAAKDRLETLAVENRKDTEKKKEKKKRRDEWNGVGVSRGSEGGPARIVIGVTCIRRGLE